LNRKRSSNEFCLKYYRHHDLNNNEELLAKTETYSSFNYMKKHYDSSLNDIMTQRGDQSNHLMKFIRNGLIGDWKSLMTDEQSQRFDALVVEKTQHMKGLEEFWFP
jgi:hypothetical protein